VVPSPGGEGQVEGERQNKIDFMLNPVVCLPSAGGDLLLTSGRGASETLFSFLHLKK
jgi:hypothetical protein